MMISLSGFPILALLTFLPLVGVGLLLAVDGRDDAAVLRIRRIALATTLAELAAALAMWAGFDPSAPGFQFVEQPEWLGGAISYRAGVDGLSAPFVLLTAVLTPFCVLASWRSITFRVKEYMIAFLVLETLLIGVFCTLDLVFYYIFFEGCLIPMFLIIGIWGGPRRTYASYKFFLYTLSASTLMLLAIVAIYVTTGTTDIQQLLAYRFPAGLQTWLWLGFFAAFAVKLPLWPLHTWQPVAYSEAPTAGSMMLAGVLLKMGGYGLLRFSVSMFPLASEKFAPMVYALSVVAIIYASLVALRQKDIKRLIAYSSIAHMGFVTIGIFTLTPEGMQGAIFQMMSHGLIAAAMFLCAGVIIDRTRSREISSFGGLANRMPIYAAVFLVFAMANIGLPGTSGFVGEFLTLFSAFRANSWIAFFAATGLILSAAYTLWLYRRVVFGAIKPGLEGVPDLSRREIATFAPLVALTILLGVWPNALLKTSAASVNDLVRTTQIALEEAVTAKNKTAQAGRTEIVP